MSDILTPMLRGFLIEPCVKVIHARHLIEPCVKVIHARHLIEPCVKVIHARHFQGRF